MIKFERIIDCIDAHTAGEPLRIIKSGVPPIKGNTMLEKRKYFKKNYDNIRKLLMLEPRGHSGMYGCIITSSVTKDGDIGVLFTHNDGLSTMCGHGIIAVTKVAIETGILEIENSSYKKVKIDTPAGRVVAIAELENGFVKNVKFNNVPSFVYKEDLELNMDDYGKVTINIVFGGAFYVFVSASEFNLKVEPKFLSKLVEIGMKLKYKVMDIIKVEHPIEKDLNGIYGTIFTEPLINKRNKIISKNVCVFADGQVDRSPTGTGTGARVALLNKKGFMDKKHELINKSIIDTIFTGRIVEFNKIQKFNSIIPQIEGNANIIGFNKIVLEPDDPLSNGFRILGN